MTLNVNTYGRFSSQYKALAVKTLEDISKNMDGFPPQCNLYLCKTREDGIRAFEDQTRKFIKVMGLYVVQCDEPIGYQANYFLEFPDIVVVEDMAKPNLTRPDEIEGFIAHEGGHVADQWKNQKLTWGKFPTPLAECVFCAKGEFEAENNAVNAGYSSQLLARDVRNFAEIKKIDYNASYYSFLNSIGIMGIYTAFMQSSKTTKSQKQSLKRIWNNFVECKSNKSVRHILQSRELNEHPEKFGDESFLEDFIFQKHYGWNFSFI